MGRRTGAAARPAAATGVEVEMAHYWDHEGRSYQPGDRVVLDRQLAQSLIWSGYARRAETRTGPAEPAGGDTE